MRSDADRSDKWLVVSDVSSVGLFRMDVTLTILTRSYGVIYNENDGGERVLQDDRQHY